MVHDNDERDNMSKMTRVPAGDYVGGRERPDSFGKKAGASAEGMRYKGTMDELNFMINNACNDDIDTFELGKRVREWGNALTHQVNGEKQELAKQRSQLESEKVVF